MKKYIPAFLLILMTTITCGCSFHSYQTAITQIEIPHYRKPDSLTTINESQSVASLLWKDYYQDENLRALIDTALQRNLSLYSSLLQMEKANSYLQKTTHNFWPSLNLRLHQNQIQRNKPEYAFNQHGIGLSLTNWEIDLWGKLSSTKRAALANTLRQEANMQGIKVKLIADVATLYYRLIGLDTKLESTNDIIAKNQAYLTEQEKFIKLYENEATRGKQKKTAEDLLSRSNIAVEQAKAELYRAKAVKPDIEAQIFITENALNLLLSRESGYIPRTRIEYVLTPEVLTDTIRIGVPAELLQFRPDVMSAEYAVREAFHLKDAAKSAFYPSLTINASIGTEENYDTRWSDFSGTIVYNLFAGITQPIFDRGNLKYNKRIRDIESQQKLVDYKQTVLKACMEVSNILVFYQMDYRKVNHIAKRYEALRKAFDYSMKLYQLNTATYLDVLAAQSQLLQTRLDMSDAFVSYYTRRIELYKALGGGAL